MSATKAIHQTPAWRRLAILGAVAGVAALIAWNAWPRDRAHEAPESRPQPPQEGAAVVLEVPGRPGPWSDKPGGGGPEGRPTGAPPPVPTPSGPAEPKTRSLPFRLEVVDATYGDGVSAAWRLRSQRGVEWVETTETDPTVEFPTDRGLDGMLVVAAPSGFANWAEPRLQAHVAQRATALRHVWPLYPEAQLELSVMDADRRPAHGTTVSVSLAGRAVGARWTGDASGRVRGVPFLREERVELTVRLEHTPKGPDGVDWVSAVSWTGRLGSSPREVLYASVEFPPWEGPVSNALLGTGGSGSGAFRGRGRRWTPEVSGRLEVSVVGRDGKPLPYTQVNISATSTVVRTDALGSAVFPNLTPGAYDVETREPGVVTIRGNVTVENGRTSRLTLREPEGGTLDVEVVDEAGMRLPFALLRLEDRDWCDLASDGTQRTDLHTDHVGRRTLTHVTPGERHVHATFGQRSAVVPVEIRDAARTTLRLVVK